MRIYQSSNTSLVIATYSSVLICFDNPQNVQFHSVQIQSQKKECSSQCCGTRACSCANCLVVEQVLELLRWLCRSTCAKRMRLQRQQFTVSWTAGATGVFLYVGPTLRIAEIGVEELRKHFVSPIRRVLMLHYCCYKQQAGK